jgi:hypothetical protein
MKMKLSPILIIPLLVILPGGCTINSDPVPLDMCRPPFPSFTQDTSPDPPNYYWMGVSPFNDSDRVTDVQQERGTTKGMPHGNVITGPRHAKTRGG